jgi:ankyrin repeat protein
VPIDVLSLLMHCTPMMIAAAKNSESQILLLRKLGASVNPMGTAGPLHYAVLAGATDAIKLLLKLGADTNAEDQHGMTPFYYCILRSDTAVAAFVVLLFFFVFF